MGTYKHFNKGNKIFPYNVIQWNVVLLTEYIICVRHKSRDQPSRNRQKSETIFAQWSIIAQLGTAQGSGVPPQWLSDQRGWTAQGSGCVWVTFATVKPCDSIKLQYQRQISRLKWLTKKGSVFSRCIMWLYFCIKWDHRIGNIPPHTYANKLTEVVSTMPSINKQHNKVWGH